MSREVKPKQPDAAVKTPSRTTAVASSGYKIMKTQVLGRIQRFNMKDGYGFIKRADTVGDVFVHHSAIARNHQGQSLCSVGEGQKVQFDIVLGRKGPQAENVTGPGGVPIQCKCEGVKHTESRMVGGSKPKEHVKKERIPKEPETKVCKQPETKVCEEPETKVCKQPETKVCKATTTEDLAQAEPDESIQVKEDVELLKEQLAALKITAEEERAAMRAELQKNLQDKEENLQTKLEAHKADCSREEKEHEARFREELEAQKAQFKEQLESKTDKSWVYIVGGVCLVAGFLTAKCLKT